MHDHEAEEHNQTSRLETSYSSSRSFKLKLEHLQQLKKTPTESNKAQKNRVEFRATSFLQLLQTKVSEKRWEARRRCGQRESKRSNSNESKRASRGHAKSGGRGSRGSSSSLFTEVTSGFVT
jgi:hypothetical protein